MTISLSNNSARISYTVAQGATQTSFTVPFEFFDDADLNVYVDGTKKTITTHYTVTGGSGSTGTVAISVTGATGGSTVVLTRDIPLARTTDFPTSGPFDVTTLNTELDRFTAQLADQKDENDRSITLQDTDSAASMNLPLKDDRKGKYLAFNATTGAPEAGASTADVALLTTVTTDIATLADIEDGTTATNAISGLAGIKTDVTAVSNIATAVSAVNSNSANINAVNSNSSNINTVAGKESEITSVAAKASLLTSDFVSDLNTLAVTDVINDINLLATSDIVSDLNTLATTDIVSDLNTLATTDIVSDVNTLATSDIVTDLNLLATSDFVSDLNTLATSGNVTAINNVSGSIANVNTAATALNEITSFNDLFSVGSSAPSSPSEGDLWYDTSNSSLKVYVGSSFQTAGAYLQGLTTTHVFTATSNQTTFTTDDASATMSIFANGNTLVFKNGIRLVEGSNSTNDYYISGNNVVLNAGASAGDVLYVEVFTKVSTTQEASLNTLVSNATTQANNASTSASTSSTQATNSANSATASANSATASATSATNSANSATASASSATSAASSATSAAASFDDLDDRYLGAKSSAPSVDNDGDALGTGALYWNTTSNKLFVWDGSAWQQGSFTAGSLLANLLEDTTPQLGGDLDVVTHSIVSTSNRDIAITPNGSGSVVLDGINYPQADGSNGQFLQTNGSGQLAFATVSTPTLSSLGLDNHDNLSVDSSGNVAVGSVTLSNSAPQVRLKDTDVNRQLDVTYGTRAVNFDNEMATGEDMDTVAPWTAFRFIDDSETREVLRVDTAKVTVNKPIEMGSQSVKFGTSKWAIVLDGNDLDFQYNGTTVFKLASNGAVTSANDITAFGSP